MSRAAWYGGRILLEKHMTKKITALVSLLLITAWIGTAFADSSSGLTYLRGKQGADGTIGGLGLTGWAVQALAAHGERNVAAVESLKTMQTTLKDRPATDIEKQILSLVAAGENPRTFIEIDAVALLKSKISNNQIGEADQVNDDIFGIIALKATGEAVPAGVITKLIANQNQDGGWGIYTQTDSSTDMAALGVIALNGLAGTDAAVTKAKAYIQQRQNDDGGFATSSGESSVGSTAWVDWMIGAMGQGYGEWTKNNRTSRDYLWTNQGSDGSWSNSVLLTSYALIALSGKGFPYVGPVATPTVSPTATLAPSPTPTITPASVLSFTPSPSPQPSPEYRRGSEPVPIATDMPTNKMLVASTMTVTPSIVPSPSQGEGQGEGSISSQAPKQVAHVPVVYNSPIQPTPSVVPSPAPSPIQVALNTVTATPINSVSSPTPAVAQATVSEAVMPLEKHLLFGAALLGLNVVATGGEILKARKRLHP